MSVLGTVTGECGCTQWLRTRRESTLGFVTSVTTPPVSPGTSQCLPVSSGTSCYLPVPPGNGTRYFSLS